jgi:hypothetical protein
MPRFDIDSYRSNFQGGARQYLFYYKPVFPGGVDGADTEIATYLVRTASLPETSTDEIVLNWQGFDYKLAGKYTYSDWTVTFNVDVDAKILKMFNNWASLIHDPTTNKYNLPKDYLVDQQVELLDLAGAPITKYKLFGAWPKMIGNSSLDYSANEVVQFDVTFTYIYHVVDTAKYGVTPTFA